MQTFLPLPSFEASAAVLDYRRLGKQRVECMQLLNALRGGKGWSNHPACRMWRGWWLASQSRACVPYLRVGDFALLPTCLNADR